MARFNACSERILTWLRLFFSLKDEFCERTAPDDGRLQRGRWQVRRDADLRRPYCEDRPLEHVDGVRRVRVGGKALVDRALERDHVEAHLLVKELDQAYLR